MIHFDDKRYLIGNLFEGTSRTCLQRGIALRKVDEIFLTGRTRWSDIGGMLGMILGLADTKTAAVEAMAEQEAKKARARELRGDGAKPTPRISQLKDEATSLKFHGAPNLNYAIATARRFTFRTGMPLEAIEHAAADTSAPDSASIPPTLSDGKLQIWTLSILPEDQSSAFSSKTNGRKRSFDQANYGETSVEQPPPDPTIVVNQMFNSDWRMDRLVQRPLSEVALPATIFVKRPETGKIEKYAGPLPGGNDPVPDIQVLVRQPWPGATQESLAPTEPSYESLSYIVRNRRQRGRFIPQKAIDLEVQPRSLWTQLTKGIAVKNIHGKDITPEMVLEPGRQGRGFAVLDIPSRGYVGALLSRPEWDDETVMDGVGAIFWNLGADLVNDNRIKTFQGKLSHMQHIVSSPNSRKDGLILDTAARSAWRHHQVDPDIFPKLISDPAHLVPDAEPVINREDASNNVIQASPGLRVNLEPKFELIASKTISNQDEEALTQTSREEYTSLLAEKPTLVPSKPPDPSGQPPTLPSLDTQVLTLGTGSSHPSTHRNVSGTLIRVPQCGSYLLDCGEGTIGTLRRLYTASQLTELLKDLKMIYISHMHADHHLGTTSLIKAWYSAVHSSNPSSQSDSRLSIVSDAPMLHWLGEYSTVEDFGYAHLLPLATTPTKNALNHFTRTPTTLRISPPNHPASSSLDDSTPAHLSRMNLSALSTVYVSHCRGAQALTFTTTSSLKVAYSGDCRPSAQFAAIAKNAHLLVHEATLEDEMRVEARAKRHCTAGEALVVASKMGARAVVLSHFSQRYPRMPPLGVERGGSGMRRARGSQDAAEAGLREAEGTPGDGEGEAPPSLPEMQPHAPRHRGDMTTEELDGVVGKGEVERLIQESGMMVVMAFDYMRLRLGDMPRLVGLQGLLRGLYERLDGSEEGAEKRGEDDRGGGKGRKKGRGGGEKGV